MQSVLEIVENIRWFQMLVSHGYKSQKGFFCFFGSSSYVFKEKKLFCVVIYELIINATLTWNVTTK